MIVYADSSALVKRYVRERASIRFRRLLASAEVVGTVSVTRVEIASALRRLEREGRIGRRGVRRVFRALEEDWEMRQLCEVPVSDLLIRRAQQCVADHDLRAGDAMQLAAAILWSGLVAEPVTFAVFDTRLRIAAQAQGFAIWPAR